MHYKYCTDIQYLNKKQQEAVNEFVAMSPLVGHVYDNGKEKRTLGRWFLPEGCQTKDTIYFVSNEKTYFHTPLASHKEPGGLVYYGFEGESKTCTVAEWVKWLGNKFEVAEVDPPELSEGDKAMEKFSASRKAAIDAGTVPKPVTPEEYQKKSDKAVWKSPVKKKKS